MPWKLFFFLLALTTAALFIGVNLDNRCDVSVLVHTFRDVPVFVSLLFAYVAGALSVIPFLFGFLRSRRKRERAGKGADRTRGAWIRPRESAGNDPASRARGKPSARNASRDSMSRNVYDID